MTEERGAMGRDWGTGFLAEGTASAKVLRYKCPSLAGSKKTREAKVLMQPEQGRGGQGQSGNRGQVTLGFVGHSEGFALL